MIKRIFSLKRFLIITLLHLIGFSLYFTYQYYRTVDIGDTVITVIIKPGDSLNQVARQLLDDGVVESRMMLVYPARLMNLDRKLTPGRYDFTGRNSCKSVLAKLESADFLRIKLTIPEGTTIWKVASLVAAKMQLDSAGLVDLNHDSTFLAQHNLTTLEGFLFPETYFFTWGVGEKEVAAEMVTMYYSQTDSIWPDSIIGNLSRYDIVNLASIIEAETGQKNERALVSSVYHNRLRKRMKLDADPTVIYGLGGLERPLYRNDLKKDTPYNTYLHRDLPPTPINSPGLAAIKAALNPEESDYFYFVADNTGGHIFSRTVQEHNRAKQRVKSEQN